jgi:hypothetical protein
MQFNGDAINICWFLLLVLIRPSCATLTSATNCSASIRNIAVGNERPLSPPTTTQNHYQSQRLVINYLFFLFIHFIRRFSCLSLVALASMLLCVR